MIKSMQDLEENILYKITWLTDERLRRGLKEQIVVAQAFFSVAGNEMYLKDVILLQEVLGWVDQWTFEELEIQDWKCVKLGSPDDYPEYFL